MAQTLLLRDPEDMEACLLAVCRDAILQRELYLRLICHAGKRVNQAELERIVDQAFQEFQTFAGRRIDLYTRYKITFIQAMIKG